MQEVTCEDVRAERKRFKGQCNKILKRLQIGPATNRELADISLKYTSRISDLRDGGYQIEVCLRNYANGLTTYRLAEDGQ